MGSFTRGLVHKQIVVANPHKPHPTPHTHTTNRPPNPPNTPDPTPHLTHPHTHKHTHTPNDFKRTEKARYGLWVSQPEKATAKLGARKPFRAPKNLQHPPTTHIPAPP